MTSIFNVDNFGSFIRQSQVFIFPLSEASGIKNKSSAIVLSSSGLDTELRIVFTVSKNLMAMGMPNTLQVSFYNLASATKQFLSKKSSAFLLEAGYKEGGVPLQTVATAGISSVISKREKEDIVTTIFGYDGQAGLAASVSSKAYQGVTQLKQIVADLADDIEGVEVSDAGLLIDESIMTGSKGRVLTGRTSTLLQKLAREFGFSWSINNGIFKAVQDTFTSGDLFVISSKAGNLINVSPRIDNIVQRVVSVEINSIFDPRINAGDLVRVESEATPLANGTYQVTNVTHVGDTHSDAWNTNITCMLNEFQRVSTLTAANALGIFF